MNELPVRQVDPDMIDALIAAFFLFIGKKDQIAGLQFTGIYFLEFRGTELVPGAMGQFEA